jgi:phospholipase A1
MAGSQRRRVSWVIALAVVAWSPCVVRSAPERPDRPLPPPPPVFQVIDESPGMSLHDEMYVLPYTHADMYHGSRSEIVYQLSVKQTIFTPRLYFAYRQLSFWQAYNVKESSPFRDSNYNPEVFYRFAQRPWAGGSLGADFGIEHESNGQRDAVSRSWNQFHVTPAWQRGGLLLRMAVRWRIPEKAKSSPSDALGDDNPDITDYLGYADLHAYYRGESGRQAHLMVRGNPVAGHGYVSLNLSRNMPHEPNAWFVLMLSHGYGESLLDYDRKVSRVGIGFMLAR